ncbi:acetyl-CoA C-acetyltransferase [Microbulbifer discodermiae]|uniref:acetyl-CoA C-acetyltransferase n=1 Tax=Microbulbifer sp. 2201CG32-9 TaxID=3232309 RepID=UPI00345B5E73
MPSEAYIYDALRTPRGKGKPGGALYEVKPISLLASLLDTLQSRSQFDTGQLDDLVMGCVTPIGDQGADIAKTAALVAGWDWNLGGVTLNRFCASGAEAVNLAAAKVRSGWEHLIVAGGVESMSRVPMGSDGGAWSTDPRTALDTNFIPQGVSADLIATLDGFSREDLDNFALRSQQRADAAWAGGAFQKSVVPVRDQSGLIILQRDQLVRADTSLEGLTQLQPSFAAVGAVGFDSVARATYPQLEHIEHMHTAGNSSGIADGAAVLLIGSERAGREQSLTPRARIAAAAVVGTDPTIMLTGPAPATLKALAAAGLKIEDIDLFEVNEAFAAVVLRFQRELDIDPEKVNVNGGAIAMGHPLGATGAMLIGTLLDELERRQLRYGLVTLCVGGGMGVATIIERL